MTVLKDKKTQPHEGGVSVAAFLPAKSGGDDIDINDDESFTIGMISRFLRKIKRYFEKKTFFCE